MAKNTANVGNKTGILPTGTVVWKKVNLRRNGMATGKRVVLEMVVLEDGLVPNESKATFRPACANDRKCRVPLVYVRAAHVIQTARWDAASDIQPGDTFHAIHDESEYKVGAIYKPDFWDTTKNQCAAGVHCFRTRAEAEAY